MMRIWGRVNGVWQAATTDAAGYNDYVYITNLIQVLKLNRGESPFFANYGIPAQNSVFQQIPPDVFVAITQRQFAPFFASLIIARLPADTPTYRVSLVTHQGVAFQADIPT